MTEDTATAATVAAGCPHHATTAPSGCPHLDGYDPLHPEQIGNPWPWLARARSDAPVFFMPEYDMYVVTRHEEALAIYRDPISYSNEGSHDMRVPVP